MFLKFSKIFVFTKFLPSRELEKGPVPLRLHNLLQLKQWISAVLDLITAYIVAQISQD